jgi:hypothetical protein
VSEHHHQPIDDSSPQVRFESVDHLPDGRLVARAEYAHETVFLVVEVEAVKDFPRFLLELAAVCQEGIATQMWQRAPIAPPDEDKPAA